MEKDSQSTKQTMRQQPEQTSVQLSEMTRYHVTAADELLNSHQPLKVKSHSSPLSHLFYALHVSMTSHRIDALITRQKWRSEYVASPLSSCFPFEWYNAATRSLSIACCDIPQPHRANLSPYRSNVKMILFLLSCFLLFGHLYVLCSACTFDRLILSTTSYGSTQLPHWAACPLLPRCCW